MSSERTKRKGKERKGKERKGQGRPDCGQEPRGAHAAVRLGSSTSSGMRGITYRNTTTSTTTSPPTAPSVHRKHRVPRPPVHARKPPANQPFSIAQPPSLPPSPSPFSSRANDSSGVMCPPLCPPGDLEYQLPLEEIVASLCRVSWLLTILLGDTFVWP